MNKTIPHLTDDQLATLALGHANAELTVHLQMCDACQAEASVYRTIVRATRDVFCDEAAPVDLVGCVQAPTDEGMRCEAIDPTQRLHISLTRIDGLLFGQVTADSESCDCWHQAAVRLFGGEGLVSTGKLSSDGDFTLAFPDTDRRYSLGLVLPRQGVPELKIIGHIYRG
jgi:hypothetical protein